MKNPHRSRFFALLLSVGFAAAPAPASAEDIDIFTASGGSGGTANVLIILDNTANWNTASQHWPDNGGKQGQAELAAIKTAVSALGANINVGLMFLVNDSGTGPGGGYVQYAIRPMDATNKPVFLANVQNIWNNFGNWQVPTSAGKYSGALMDAFHYFGGYTSPAHALDNVAAGGFAAPIYGDASSAAGTITFATGATVTNTPGEKNHFGPNVFNTMSTWTSLADVAAYKSGTFATYNPPATAGSNCAQNYVIVIGNGFPNKDPGNSTYLAGIGGNTSTIIPSLGATAAEWARFLYRTDVSPADGAQNISTYTIDAYNAKPDANQTLLLQNMAKFGGGRYFTAQNAQMVVDALTTIFNEIQSVNSSFVSVSMPINATNRTVNNNEVYISMFRPDSQAQPRWFGNLKKYQLVDLGSGPELGDSLGATAVNPLTGFVTNCAVSYWTTDSGTYWNTATYEPAPAGQCSTSPNSPYSDAPDGPVVEKGSVAEILRNGNTTGSSPPTWSSYRTLYTLSGGSLAVLTTGNTGLDATTLDWVRGRDVDNENNLSPVPAAAAQPARFSVHGDVVHSRSFVADQSNLSRGTTLYYGANDGALRAVDASNGKERWAFYSPESFTKMSRLRTDSPLIAYAGMSLSGSPTPTAKDYFFDGPIGAYQSADNSTVWIYATQRRGGRMIYAFDASTPNSPSFKWRVGCPNLGNDTGCTTGMSGIGQTWSTPKVAFIKGYSTTAPVIIVGGGYHTCEDANSSSPSCGSTKGNIVYVLDASTGAVISSFATERSVVADVTLIDVNYDGYVDYAYVADTGGNLYRLDFIASPTTYATLASNAWTVHYVGYTNGAGRKFHYAPSVLHAGTKVYVALGSGDREKPLISNYPYTGPVANRFYVYIDDLAVVPAAKANATNLDNTSAMTDFSATTSCSDAGILPSSTKKGWFMNLASGTGEQTVTSAVIVAGMVAFSTNRAIPTSALTCSANLGEARGYWVNLLNASGAIGSTYACGGTRSATFVGGGLPPSPVKSTVVINGKEVTVVVGASQLNGSPSGSIQFQKIPIPVNKKRHPIYWYQNTDN